MKQIILINPRGSSWVVHERPSSTDLQVFRSMEKALHFARALIGKGEGDIIINDANGKPISMESHSINPYSKDDDRH